MKRIGKYIVPDKTIEKMVELLDLAKINKVEYGGILYAKISDNNLILRNICSGNDYSIKMIEIPEYGYGNPIGDYHVHPESTELPTFLDLDPMKKDFEQMKFIGGTITNKIKCYTLRKLDIDLLKGIVKLERLFFDFAQKSNKENRDALLKEFRDIHDSSMKKLIDKYFDVVEIK